MSLNPSNGIAAREAERNNRSPFRNLGDAADTSAPAQVDLELKMTGLDKLPGFVKYRRDWYYWSIELEGRALPEKESLALFDKNGRDVRPFGHCAMDKDMLERWLESGRKNNRKVREDDFSDEERSLHDRLKVKLEEHPEGINNWHVDTFEGLKELVEALKSHFGEEGEAK